MHILVMILMAALIGHDGSGLARKPWLDDPTMLALWLGPFAAVALLMVAACWSTAWRIRKPGCNGPRAIRILHHFLNTCRWAVLLLFLCDVYALGGLIWMRGKVGDWVLLDELLVLAPAVVTLTLEWFFYYPIDRSMRSPASVPDVSVGTRGQYVRSQVRHQILLIFAPMSALLAWMETLGWVVENYPAVRDYETSLHFGGFVVVFALTPWAIRWLWDTAPLPRSTLRRRLVDMCRQYRVRVVEILLWRTYGGMINGAVMGFVAPFRFILLTDGLLSRMSEQQVEAVMAHELGHIRKHHMPLMLLCAFTTIFLLETLLNESLNTAEYFFKGKLPLAHSAWELSIAATALTLVVGGWLLIFGWISRRFERQADTFAVQHLSRQSETPTTIAPQAVEVYCSALQNVAAANHLPLERKSWRHGSIQWRCDYLKNLPGTPLDRCTIDRSIRRICIACTLILVALLVYDYRPELLEVLRALRGS